MAANSLTTNLPLGLSFTIATTNAGQLLFITAPGGAGGVTSVFARTGDVVAQNGDYTGNQVTGTSAVPGSTVSDEITGLGPAEAKAVSALTDADATIATTVRQVALANVYTAPRQLTITPSAVPGKTFAIDLGTQTQAVTIAGGGPQLGTQVIAAGGPRRLLVMSDGSNIVFPMTILDLGQEPTLL